LGYLAYVKYPRLGSQDLWYCVRSIRRHLLSTTFTPGAGVTLVEARSGRRCESGRRDERRMPLEHSPSVDVVALASVISSAVVGLTGAGVAFYSTHRTARTARKGRAEQRSADGYLKVFSLAEQEAQWHDASIFNMGLDRQELACGTVAKVEVPAPPA
jgi:hypothetical protein